MLWNLLGVLGANEVLLILVETNESYYEMTRRNGDESSYERLLHR